MIREYNRHDSWDTESICSLVEKLSIEDSKLTKIMRLQKLDREIEAYKMINGFSNNKFEKVIKSKGICLVDCKQYGSQLKKNLLRGKNQIKIKYFTKFKN